MALIFKARKLLDFFQSPVLGRDDSALPVDITYQKMTDGILNGIKETDSFPLNIDKPKCFVTDDLFVEC